MSAVSLSMDLEEIVRKFPSDLPRAVGLEILHFADIKTPDGKPYRSRTYKKEIVEALNNNQVKIETALGVKFDEYLEEMQKREEYQETQMNELENYVDQKNAEDVLIITESDLTDNDTLVIDIAAKQKDSKQMSETLGDDRLSDIDKIGSGLVKRWLVRYIGKKGKIVLSPTSTHSRNGYTFNRDMWVEVDERDFRRRFYPKLRNAIEAGQDPLWQIKIETLQGKVLNFFRQGVSAIVSNPPQYLKDVKHLTTDRVSKLHRYEIDSIQELLAVPKIRLMEIVGVNRTIATEILEDARRS
jgi:hypothetical protein